MKVRIGFILWDQELELPYRNRRGVASIHRRYSSAERWAQKLGFAVKEVFVDLGIS